MILFVKIICGTGCISLRVASKILTDVRFAAALLIVSSFLFWIGPLVVRVEKPQLDSSSSSKTNGQRFKREIDVREHDLCGWDQQTLNASHHGNFITTFVQITISLLPNRTTRIITEVTCLFNT